MKTKNKKGIFFTLDALFASVFAILIILFAMQLLNEGDAVSWSDSRLNYILLDALEDLDMSGTLTSLEETRNVTKFYDIYTGLPSTLCMNLALYNDEWNKTQEYIKPGCEFFDEASFQRRIYLHNDQIRYAVLYGWFDSEAS